MATYTEADRDAIKAAIIALASGQRTVTVTYDNRSVTYAQTQLADLEALLARVEAHLTYATRPRHYRLVGGTGL